MIFDATDAKSSLNFEVIEDRDHPGDWRVEAIDHDAEGLCYVATFSGPRAEERAVGYAGLMNEVKGKMFYIYYDI